MIDMKYNIYMDIYRYKEYVMYIYTCLGLEIFELHKYIDHGPTTSRGAHPEMARRR